MPFALVHHFYTKSIGRADFHRDFCKLIRHFDRDAMFHRLCILQCMVLQVDLSEINKTVNNLVLNVWILFGNEDFDWYFPSERHSCVEFIGIWQRWVATILKHLILIVGNECLIISISKLVICSVWTDESLWSFNILEQSFDKLLSLSFT